MKGQNTTNPADVGKWRGLEPVFTYADPDALETYRVFRREKDGTWHTFFDPLKAEAQSEAGTGALPRQNAIAAGYAPLFLSSDGQYWSAWRPIPDGVADTKTNTFSFAQSFVRPTATVAMRVPFTNTFFDGFCAALQEAALPEVSVEEVGKTPEGRTLRVIRVEDANDTIPIAQRPTIVVIAREHATEHDSSWAVYGLLARLLDGSKQSGQLRAAATWLLVPLQDPDGAANSQFERMTETFQKPNSPKTPPEVFAWTRYFREWANSGRRVEVAVSIHNVEANEAANLSSPFVNQAHSELIQSFNAGLFADIKKAGFQTGKSTGMAQGASPFRLYGWLARQMGTLDVAYEVNGRYPKNRLNHAQIGEIGAQMGEYLARWLWSDDGRDWQKSVARVAKLREQKRAAYLKEKGAMAPEGTERSRYELLELGF